LLARIRAVLRRAGQTRAAKPEVLELDGLRLFPAKREVRVDGNPVELTSIEYEILEFLVRAAGRVVSRDELAAVLYQRLASPFERTLDVHISHLRKKLETHRNMLRTVRGIGYLFQPGGEV